MRLADRALPALCLAALVPGASACARDASPGRVLDEYYRHLEKGRVAAAYALTTSAYRRRHDLAAFALQVARQPIFAPRERKLGKAALAVELRAPRVEPLALIASSAGGRLYLAEDPRVLYPTATPEATLRSFVRAVELGRRDRAVELCSPAVRERLGASGEPLPEAIVELARRIRGRLADEPPPLVLEATSARWLIGDGRSITLERARSGWWVAALE